MYMQNIRCLPAAPKIGDRDENAKSDMFQKGGKSRVSSKSANTAVTVVGLTMPSIEKPAITYDESRRSQSVESFYHHHNHFRNGLASLPVTVASKDTGKQSSSVYSNSTNSDFCLRFSSSAVGEMENDGYPATINFEAVAELTPPSLDTGYPSISDLNAGSKNYTSIFNEDLEFNKGLTSLRTPHKPSTHNTNNSPSSNSTNDTLLGTSSHGGSLVTRAPLKKMPSPVLLSRTDLFVPEQVGEQEKERAMLEDDGNGDVSKVGDDQIPGKRKKRSPIVIYDHITISGGEPSMYQCNWCQKKFKTKARIRYHEFCQEAEKRYKCEQCGQGFITKGRFECHLRTHTVERPYVCPTCGKGFKQKSSLTKHMHSHGGKSFVCKECNRSFAFAGDLRSHMLIHTGVRPFTNTGCNIRFMTSLEQHIVTHTGERPFCCNYCGKSFGLQWTLDLHMRTHSNERPYACDKCPKAFSMSKDLRRHLGVHTGERPFVCPKCGRGFNQREKVTRHMLSHTGEKPFVCQECNRGFAHAQGLRAHMLMHTGERPFSCTSCNKRFTNWSSLNKHILTHAGKRRFSCNHCGKSFGLQLTLDLHLRTHYGERPYACDQCSWSFFSISALLRHLVIHSGQLPFKCWICRTAFSRKDSLDRHIKSTHNQPMEVARKLANEAAAEYLKQTTTNQSLGDISVSKVHSVAIGMSKGKRRELEPLSRKRKAKFAVGEKAGNHNKNAVAVQTGRIGMKEVKVIPHRLKPSQLAKYGISATNTEAVHIQQPVSAYNKQRASLNSDKLKNFSYKPCLRGTSNGKGKELDLLSTHEINATQDSLNQISVLSNPWPCQTGA